MFAPCKKACGNQMHRHRIRQLQMVSAVLKMPLPLQRRPQQTRPRREIPRLWKHRLPRRWTQSARVGKLNSPSCAKLKPPRNVGVRTKHANIPRQRRVGQLRTRPRRRHARRVTRPANLSTVAVARSMTHRHGARHLPVVAGPAVASLAR